MKNIELIGKVIGLTVALFYFLFFQSSNAYQWISFTIILITVGIPHGALDHLLLTPKIDKRGLVKFIFKYVLIILCYLIIWIFLPLFALLAFIIMSAYHFGQSHFINYKIKTHKSLVYLALGTFYLSVIFWGDFAYTANILNNIINITQFQPYGFFIIGVMGISALVLVGVNLPTRLFYYLAEMIVLGSVLYFLPLPLGFIIYFGFWHALPSMSEEYLSLKKYLGHNKVKSFVMKMIPFTAISIVGIGLVLLFFHTSMPQDELILLFFILISLISAPHIWFMDKFLVARKT